MSRYAAAVEDADGRTLLRVRVTPRARATKLDGLHGDAARVRVAAPPAGGQANAAVVAFVASVLGVRRGDVTLVSGHKGRDKLVQVDGLDAATVAARLDAVHG